jgi:peptidoglycan/LPS O-acetylase OafA/YrhL
MALSEYEQRILTEIESDLGEGFLIYSRRRRRTRLLATALVLSLGAAAAMWLTVAGALPDAAGVPLIFVLGTGFGAIIARCGLHRRAGRSMRHRGPDTHQSRRG